MTATRESEPAGIERPTADDAEQADERLALQELYRDLRTSPAGLTQREAVRRQTVYGPNELVRRTGRRWPAELLAQWGPSGCQARQPWR